MKFFFEPRVLALKRRSSNMAQFDDDIIVFFAYGLDNRQDYG